MAIWQDPRSNTERSGGVHTATVGVPSVTRDAGLRSYMLSVYNYMASGVLLTGIIALGVANSSLINLIVNPATGQATPLFWVALFAPLGIVFALSFGINRISARTAQGLRPRTTSLRRADPSRHGGRRCRGPAGRARRGGQRGLVQSTTSPPGAGVPEPAAVASSTPSRNPRARSARG